MSDLPQTAIDAAAAAVRELPEPDSRFERDRWRIVMRVALDAAAPHIIAAEHQRQKEE